MNKLTVIQNDTQRTPIEIALQVDEEGRTTARKLYEFLELDKSNYSKWCRVNILENTFADENVDYIVFVPKDENPKGGRPTTDYKLTASFAKKLAMGCQNERGEQAREYFIKVEDKLKEVASKHADESTTTKKTKTLASVNNAAKIILPSLKDANLDPVQVTYFLKNLYAPVGIDIPMIRVEHDKMYDQTAIAETLGVYSKSGKPHAQAIGAILSKIYIDENDIIRTSYARNGHTGVSLQYKEPVLKQVKDWLATNGYPTIIQHCIKCIMV